MSLAAYTIGTFVAFGLFVFSGQYLQLVLGLSPLQAGLATLPFALAFIVGSMLTPAVARRVPPGSLMAWGLALAAVGFGLLALAGTFGLPIIMTSFLVYSLGLAPVITLATDLIVGSAPPERAGAASAISETGSELGGALGIAILGSLGTAVYRSRMAGPALDHVPPHAMEAARGTLGGAVAAVRDLPDRVGLALLDTARLAFTDALTTVAIVSALVSLMTAIVVFLQLRRVDAAPEATAHADASAAPVQR